MAQRFERERGKISLKMRGLWEGSGRNYWYKQFQKLGRQQRESSPQVQRHPVSQDDEETTSVPTTVSYTRDSLPSEDPEQEPVLPLKRKMGAMSKIVDSPYLVDASAEVGEAVFEQMLLLLKPSFGSVGSDAVRGGTVCSGVSAAATKTFGEKLAKDMVQARTQIESYNVVYESEWKHGKIHGLQFGYIPKPFLLLCLPDRLLAPKRVLLEGENVDEDTVVLRRIIVDLGVHNIVKEALTVWNLEEDYENLSNCDGHFVFTSNSSRFDRCAIFVARTYRCTKHLKWMSLGGSLLEKVHACLILLDDNIRSAEVRHRKRRKTAKLPGVKSSTSLGSSTSRTPPRTIKVVRTGTETRVANGTKAFAASMPNREEHYSSSTGDSSASQNSSDEESDSQESEPSTRRPCGDKWANFESMEIIETSPYEKGSTAEIGEKAFDRLEEFLAPLEGGNSRRHVVPSNVAVKALGLEVAWSLALTYRQIALSGQAYCEEWKNGHVRGVKCDSLPSSLMLLCLQGSRLSKAPVAVVKAIIRDLEVSSIVKDALTSLQLNDAYANLASASESFVYTSNAKQCLRCEIFVARAHSCMETLNLKWKEGSLKQKVMACLEKMNNNTQGAVPSLKRKNSSRPGGQRAESSRKKLSLSKPAPTAPSRNSINEEPRTHQGSPGMSAHRAPGSSPSRLPSLAARPEAFKDNITSSGKRQKSNKGSIFGKFEASKRLESPQITQKGMVREEFEWTPRPNLLCVSPASKATMEKQMGQEKAQSGYSFQLGGAQTPSGDLDRFGGPGAEDNPITMRQAADSDARKNRGPPSLEFMGIALSPYEKRYNAESDENAFKEMMDLLRPRPKNSYQRGLVATDGAIKHFGSELAASLVATYSGIDATGMFYGPDWLDGRILGVECGEIPKPMLLLCLQTDRIAARAAGEQTASMAGAIRQLELFSIVKKSMSRWNLEDAYANLASCRENFSFTSNKIQCQKCAIFVARAFSCFEALKRQADDSLMGKVRACLQIMDDHVEESTPIAKAVATSVGDNTGSHRSLLKRKVSGDGATGTYKRPPTGPTGKAVEKLCLKTGKVLERFDSVRAAASCWPPQSQQNSKKRLYDVLNGQRPSFGGFFWRYAEGPPTGPTGRAIEKLCLKTGKVLERFDSVRAAASCWPPQSQENSRKRLYDALNGQRPSFEGFFWRHAGTSAFPPGISPDNSPHSGTASLPPGCHIGTTEMDTSFDPSLLGPRLQDPSHGFLKHLGAKPPPSSSTSTTNIADNPSIFAEHHGEEGATMAKYKNSNGDHTFGVPPPLPVCRSTQKGRPPKAVEKLCLKTGKVLERFDSLKGAMSAWPLLKKTELYAALRKEIPSPKGFFWRYANFSVVPPGILDNRPHDFGSAAPATSGSVAALETNTSIPAGLPDPKDHGPCDRLQNNVAKKGQSSFSDSAHSTIGSTHKIVDSTDPTIEADGMQGEANKPTTAEPKYQGPCHALLKNQGAKARLSSPNGARSTSISGTLAIHAASDPVTEADGMQGEGSVSIADRLIREVRVKPYQGKCYPDDPDEFILNSTEIELAWLCEESIYCLQQKEIHWPFIYEFASPSLQIELRRVSADESNKLEGLVRFNNIMVSRRFPIKRRIIRRKMHNGDFRNRMRKVIVHLRLASRKLGTGKN